ncbi:MAG: alpha/beta fold hydrolase [Pseudomonadales bacterium]|nr:alpha/beta fold hydrolase [Pseudomonadales bacterium]
MKSFFSALIAALILMGANVLAADEFVFYSDLAKDWYESGDYFEWTSTTVNNNDAKVDVFYRTFGDRSNPELLLIHGFPTSSFDYQALIPLLVDDYFIATLDFPGSGFSEKPLGGFSYMLEDNARLVDYFVREIVEFQDFAMFTHDRGVSIGLAFLGHYLDNPSPEYTLNYHFLSNSGMYLPLANLLPFQLAVLDPAREAQVVAARKAQPRVTEGDPIAVANADIFKFNDGDSAIVQVGKYLLERGENETRWLENLPRSPVPVAYLWGLLDVVNPIRIPNYVWLNYLNQREVESSFWILPTAGHYPQRDNPEEVAKVIRLALSGNVPTLEDENAFMRQYAGEREAEDAIYVGRSVPRKMEFPWSDMYTPEGYVNPVNP